MTRWQKLEKGIVTGCTVSVVLYIMGMNLLINAARREMRGPKTESGIYFPSSRGFMDDLTLTTATHVQARWMLAALTDIASWGRMKFKAVKSRSLVIKKGQTTERFKLYVQNEEFKVTKSRLVLTLRDSPDEQEMISDRGCEAGREHSQA